jgi:hypothetical protein
MFPWRDRVVAADNRRRCYDAHAIEVMAFAQSAMLRQSDANR